MKSKTGMIISNYKKRAPNLLLNSILSITLLIVVSGCVSSTKVFHSDVFSRGEVLEKGKGEVGLQIATGFTSAVGLGAGYDLRLRLAAEGERVIGGEIKLGRFISRSNLLRSKATVGFGYLVDNKINFISRRLFVGYTPSLYTKNGRFGFHLPIKFYHMNYDRPQIFVEPGFISVDAEKKQGEYFVVGIGISVEGEKAAFRLGINTPTQNYLHSVELLPVIGLQVAYKW